MFANVHKGMELPINVLVIVVIAVVVLLSLLYLTMQGTTSASGTTLESATKATCLKINPMFCENKASNRVIWARMPVDNFDANGNGIINEHTPIGSLLTSYCIDDNLEMLCYKYYGCSGKPDCSINLVSDDDWNKWYNCCIVNVCGCIRT